MLTPVFEHPWDVSPKEAVAIQRKILNRHAVCDLPERIESVGGIDMGIKNGQARAAVVIMSFPELEIVEQAVAERPIAFPYVPGLLSFREAPAILDVLAVIQHTPDVLLFDGQGYAHPRRMGLATHLGILLDHPTIGCAKSRLCGQAEEPDEERGSFCWLEDQDTVIGAVVRTRTRVRPVYVSVGHRVRLAQAIDLVLQCGRGYRLPEPTRWAHRLASGHAEERRDKHA